MATRLAPPTSGPVGPQAARSRPRRRDGGRWREPFARGAAAVVSLAAVWSLASAVVIHSWRDAGADLFSLVNVPQTTTLFTISLLFLLAGALHRRLRVALWTLIAFQVLALADAAAQIILALRNTSGPLLRNFSVVDRVELVVSLLAVAVLTPLLLRARSAFPARLYPVSRRSAPLVLLAGLVVSATVTLTLAFWFPGTLADPGERVLWAIRVVVGVDGGRIDATGHLHEAPHWIATLAGLLSGLALVAATVVFLRAAGAKLALDGQDELDLRHLLLDSGARDSLGYFATRRDRSVVFGPQRRAAVTHRVLASVSLAAGDPVGPPDAWSSAMAAWMKEAHAYGWYPAVIGASEEGARAYVAAGLKAIPLGDEAILDVRGFSLRSPALQPVRRAVERIERSGYTVQVVRHADLGTDELAEMARCADEWRGAEPERGFSMALNRLADPTDGRCVAVRAIDASGRLRGLLSLVPWGPHGLSLDLMRRDPAAENGVTEFMVAGLITACPDFAVTRVSLNFVVLRGVLEAADRVGAGPLVRTGNAALLFTSRFWQLETLYRTTARYRPRWEPRYLCYSSAFTLPRVALAALMAEGFLPLPPTAPAPDRPAGVTWDGRPDVPLAEAVAALETLSRSAITRGRRLSRPERVRSEKLAVLTGAGMEPYPVAVPRSDSAPALRRRHCGLAAATHTGETVSVTGRVRALRDFGGLVFAELQDGAAHVQVLLSRDRLGTDLQLLWRRAVDPGDQVSVTGEVITSDTGELSVLADSWVMAAKCLEPVPRRRGGATETEPRARDRALDLIVRPEATETLLARSRAVRALREFLAERCFSEVETPMLQAVHGGANARPFVTRSNAYSTDLYLRIAPELYLKRLCVGGMQKVFELGRNFRNEGADATHNPEFTALEVYEAFADYTTMRELARELILAAAVALHGAPVAHRRTADGGTTSVDLSEPWPVVPVHQAVSRATGVELTPGTDRGEVLAVCRRHGVRVAPTVTAGDAVVKLYEALVEARTTAPTFYTDFPVETSPLARAHRTDPRLAERWDLVAFGMELGTAYSELIDPVDQRRRLTEQSLRAVAGDAEAMQVDEDFLHAMSYGMPPTGGLGLGVDRLVMMLSGVPVRSTLAFPFVRPQGRP